jgi:uncharacterized Rossmann fold enzyme
MQHPCYNWTIPKIWTGTAYIIGGGPSLKDVDLTLLHDKHVIGVNDAYLLGDWVDFTFFGDFAWWDLNREGKYIHKGITRKYSGIVVTNAPGAHAAMINQQEPAIKTVKRNNRTGISTDPNMLCWNLSSGACAVNLAYLLGVRRVVLVGFDMKLASSGQSNWHVNLKDKPNEKSYIRFMKAFDTIAPIAKKLGFEILNANMDSAMTAFPKVELKNVI